MDEKELIDIVENFKGIIWDELEDSLTDASREELIDLIRMLKVRFGQKTSCLMIKALNVIVSFFKLVYKHFKPNYKLNI